MRMETINLTPMKYIYFLALLLSIYSCSSREFEPPEEVQEILELAGENRTQLEAVIQHFKDEEGNKMENWSFAQTEFVNSDTNANLNLTLKILNSNTTTTPRHNANTYGFCCF